MIFFNGALGNSLSLFWWAGSGSDLGQFWCIWFALGCHATACLWLGSGKQDRTTRVPSFHTACGPDERVRWGPDLGHNNLAIYQGLNPFEHQSWMWLALVFRFEKTQRKDWSKTKTSCLQPNLKVKIYFCGFQHFFNTRTTSEACAQVHGTIL